MIEMNHLTRRYGDLLAVDDVSFSIGAGEVVGLLGHNGAGKTTVMKMLTGALEPTAGTLRVGELEIGRDTAAIQARIGYLPENCPVWPDLTVIEFLEYQAALHGVPEAQRRVAVATAIRRTALKEKATAPIQTLSRGYRQRVGVAQAILHAPEIVILDEPTNGLDPTQILHMRELIRELSAHATVIVSTHILQEVEAVCERVVIMKRGRKVADARLDDLQRGARLLVTLDRDEASARPVLTAVPGVRGMRLDAALDGRWRYALDVPETAAPAVSAAVHAAGFGLHALTPERRDLETVFAEVNRTETPVADTEVRHAA
ncbi:ABC transporter ATP-binding protein [Nitrogeniibacter mangrovi]|uniref:ABC transporter ATP-binding protein n=1 Tax=Nitrogeniibacter mangrovi TaxID=2016596 RepID=A0A6C1B1S3_9RHOO|nr:ABC transporter ATP-binding protein [Nitrogeniibacter mangrovi]QID16929.1 ABC transporter ATP-binding protein [Nitrogeniibacter mangrovi]